jgi:O-glycosyl hydrolase
LKTFYGDAWSAPGFMKTNNNDSYGGGICGTPGTNCTSGDWRQAYADYLTQYVKYYAEAGINVTHLGFTNEPEKNKSYASMQLSGAQAADFIKVLHPTLARNNMSHIAITCCELGGWTLQSQYTEQLKAAGVESLVGVITGHTYSSEISGPQPTSRKVWETEASDLNGNWSAAWYTNGSSGDGYTWADKIHTGLTTGNVSAYLWWVATEGLGFGVNKNDKLILVDGQDYEVSKRLWAFAQFSRTVRPGAVRVNTAGGTGLKTSAFVNVDGKLAVNVINTGGSAVSVRIVGFNGTDVQAWVTDNTHDMEPAAASITAGTVAGSLPGRGMVSFVVS